MSDVNPKNFDGATVTLVGRAGGPAEIKEFANSKQAQLSIAVGKGYKNKTTDEWVDTGTDWYTLTASADYAEENWPDVGKGDKVRVDDARLELKGYTNKDGVVGLDATLRFGTIVIVEKKADASSDKPW
jgi:single-stranded DNA-binding protein